MTIPTFTPVHGPQPGFNREKKPEVNNNPFGDNFSQRSPKGLNNLLMKAIPLQWELLTWAQASAMETFFDDLKGKDPFYYILPPDISARKFICSTYGASPNKGDDANFTATFEEVP
jgi:phage-related protein